MATPPSDLVRDSELTTPICDHRQSTRDSSRTEHEFVEEGRHPGQREVRRREVWIRDDRPLGSGGSGQVWRERLLGSSRSGYSPQYRAVKQIVVTVRHRRSAARVNREEYTRELEAIMKFSQPKYSRCFVVARGWYERSPWLYIDMEYFRFGDLHGYIFDRRWRMPENEQREIARQILEGLRYMHNEGFAHRDLKPSNILVKARPPITWWVKIGDFGISKRLTAERDVATVVGTEGYAAPELERVGLGRETNIEFNYQAADMWSLGVVLFQMITRNGSYPDVGQLGHHHTALLRRGLGPTLRGAGATSGARQFAKSCLLLRPEDRITARDGMQNPWILGREKEEEEGENPDEPQSNTAKLRRDAGPPLPAPAPAPSHQSPPFHPSLPPPPPPPRPEQQQQQQQHGVVAASVMIPWPPPPGSPLAQMHARGEISAPPSNGARQDRPAFSPVHIPSPLAVGSPEAQRSIARRPLASPTSSQASPTHVRPAPFAHGAVPASSAGPMLSHRTSASSTVSMGPIHLEGPQDMRHFGSNSGMSSGSRPLSMQSQLTVGDQEPRNNRHSFGQRQSWSPRSRFSNDSYFQQPGLEAVPERHQLDPLPPPEYLTTDGSNTETVTAGSIFSTTHVTSNIGSASQKLLGRKRSAFSLTFSTKNAFASTTYIEAFGSAGSEKVRIRTLQAQVGGPQRLSKLEKRSSSGALAGPSEVATTSQARKTRSQPTSGNRLTKTARGGPPTARGVSTSALKKYGNIPVTSTTHTLSFKAHPLEQRLARILISSDSRLLFTLGRPDRLGIWETESGKEISSSEVPDVNPGSAVLHPSGELLLFELVEYGNIILWNTVQGKATHSIEPSVPDGLGDNYGLAKQVFDLSPDGRLLAVLHIWEQTLAFVEDYRAYMSFIDMQTRQSVGKIAIPLDQNNNQRPVVARGHGLQTGVATLVDGPDFHIGVSFTPASQHVVVRVKSSLYLVGCAGERQVRQILDRPSLYLSLATPVMNRMVFTSILDQPSRDATSRHGTLVMWDMATPQTVLELVHPFNLIGCAVNRDGSLALTVSTSMAVFWDLEGRIPLFRMSTNGGGPAGGSGAGAGADPISTRYNPCELAADGSFFVTYHASGARVWDVPPRLLAARGRGHRRDTTYWSVYGLECRELAAPEGFPSGRAGPDTIPATWGMASSEPGTRHSGVQGLGEEDLDVPAPPYHNLTQ